MLGAFGGVALEDFSYVPETDLLAALRAVFFTPQRAVSRGMTLAEMDQNRKAYATYTRLLLGNAPVLAPFLLPAVGAASGLPPAKRTKLSSVFDTTADRSFRSFPKQQSKVTTAIMSGPGAIIHIMIWSLRRTSFRRCNN